MIQQDIITKRDATLALIDKAKVDEQSKMIFRDLINHAADGTNGLDEKAKLQSVSESVFVLSVLGIMQSCAKTNYGAYRLIESCRWQIVIIAVSICILIGYRPQIVELVGGLLH